MSEKARRATYHDGYDEVHRREGLSIPSVSFVLHSE